MPAAIPSGMIDVFSEQILSEKRVKNESSNDNFNSTPTLRAGG